jgi:hypothetical protein
MTEFIEEVNDGNKYSKESIEQDCNSFAGKSD